MKGRETVQVNDGIWEDAITTSMDRPTPSNDKGTCILVSFALCICCACARILRRFPKHIFDPSPLHVHFLSPRSRASAFSRTKQFLRHHDDTPVLHSGLRSPQNLPRSPVGSTPVSTAEREATVDRIIGTTSPWTCHQLLRISDHGFRFKVKEKNENTNAFAQQMDELSERLT